MTIDANEVREQVRERYAAAARAASQGSTCGCDDSCCTDGERVDQCCGAECCAPDQADDFGQVLYSEVERNTLPTEAVLASLGCGNPTAVAELREGDTVLDLGSGGGIDVILSARRVGPTGHAPTGST